MCGSALFEPCGAAFCRVAPLQSSDSSSPSRFFSEYFPPAETGAVSCFSFSVQAAVGAIAARARAHGLEAAVSCLVLSINLIHCGNEFRNSVPVRTLGL